MKILALDLGKFKSVACLYESGSAKCSFQTIRTTPSEVRELVLQAMPNQLVFEICSFGGWIHDLAVELGIVVQVANPNHEGWRWNHVKRKTDRDDALKLARLAAMNQLPTVYVPARPVRQWRALIAYRHKLVGRQTAIRNSIRSIFTREGLALPVGHRAWTAEGFRQMAREARTLGTVGGQELWRGMLDLELRALEEIEPLLVEAEAKLNAIAKADERVRRLQTIPGVGPRPAEVIVATIDDPHRFDNAREVACYAGLTPKQYESGMMQRTGRISRHGPALLRGMLVEVAWLVKRYNPWGDATFRSVTKGQRSRRKQAIVALARRLLVRAWAMMRDGTSWQAPASSTTPA
jgi:transposase